MSIISKNKFKKVKMIEKILKNLPQSPWIYKFFDKSEKIIYIWKSVNLKSRVSSYFNWKSKLNFAKKKMVSQIKNIEYILTNNEKESLILETTLIKEFSPKYNVLMKDDKNHIYLKITKEEIPRIIKTRIKTASGEYFWPYISTNNTNKILKLTKRVFWHRSCNLNFKTINNKLEIIWNFRKKSLPCMDYYIWTCAWPCLLENSKISLYKEKFDKLRDFMKWNHSKIIDDLKGKMAEKARDLKFEEAQTLKEDIIAIEGLSQWQIVRDVVVNNADIINIIEKYWSFFIWVSKVRESKFVWHQNYQIQNKLEEEKKEILEYFIADLYAWNKEKLEVILPFEVDINKDFLEEVKIKILASQIWDKVKLLTLCYKNVLEYATKSHLESLSTKWFTKKDQQELLKVLWYKEINKKIVFECNDISHLWWTHTVASRSVIENGKSNKNLYKKFNIKTLKNDKIDDFDSMREIMERRIKEIEKSKILPDLIIIDWWKWQLSSVLEVIERHKKRWWEIEGLLNNLQIVSIAKREEELFLPWKKEGILLKKDDIKIRLVQRIRDEAHRFAITFNREKRIASMKKNLLEELPWFWTKTRKKVLEKFWSVENLKKQNEEDILKILNKNQIETLKDHWII